MLLSLQIDMLMNGLSQWLIITMTLQKLNKGKLPVHILLPFPPSALYTKVMSTDPRSTVYKWIVRPLVNPASTHTDPQ